MRWRFEDGSWIGGGEVKTSESRSEGSQQSRRLPVLFFARSLEESLGRVIAGGIGVVTVPGGGHLQLTGHQGGVTITSEQGRPVDVPLVELKEAVGAFKGQLLDLVRRELPWMFSHPEVGPWLRSS
jgi:hypothetical protein